MAIDVAISYTAIVAFITEGFDNWNKKRFGVSVALGDNIWVRMHPVLYDQVQDFVKYNFGVTAIAYGIPFSIARFETGMFPGKNW